MPRYSITEFEEIDSTNLYARRQLRDLADGTVIQARTQTAGRGRWQRSWVSHVPGNLCLTIVLKPAGTVADLPLANLSQLLAVSLCRVLDSQGVQATLKWPNDIQVEGRKIAGILAETVVEGQEFLGLLLGIGVNLNLDAATLARIDQPATSLSCVLGCPVDIAEFRDSLLRTFFDRCDDFLQQGFVLIREEYLSRFTFLNQTVDIRWPTGDVRGVVRTIDHQGALELTLPTGEIRTVSLGEILAPSPAAAAT
jgi:BirA family biotin operon repressor/biotin-[acetyl-CoA-carboxylase] ligase